MRDKLFKSTAFICTLIVVLIISSLFIINSIYSKSIETEIVKDEEEVEDIVLYVDYDWDNLSGDIIKTYEDENYTSMFGIDVAAHQDVIDWKKVKESGVEFAYIRLGYRGALEGKLNIDEQFENNYKGAKEAGIKVGVYWYSQPVDELEAIAEADFVIEILDGRDLDLPIAYDFEETMFSNDYSRIHGMNKNNCTANALAFCVEMYRHNYETILYTNMYWAENNYDWDILSKYNTWYAQYDCECPQFDRPMMMWQYSDNGYIDGINRNCDLNIMFVKKNG